ncbi:MAG: pentapeptide repeat-containing protein [Candidatus Hodarchaeota archaeon]
MASSKCNFSFDLENLNYVFRSILNQYGYYDTYQCPNDIEEGNTYCIFHDKDRILEYLKKGISIDFEKLPKLEEGKTDSFGNPLSPLLFVYAHFPALRFPEKNFDPLSRMIFLRREFLGEVKAEYCHFSSLEVHYSVFKEIANFNETEFKKSIIFHECEFIKNALFLNAKFYEEASFLGSLFRHVAHFMNTEFFDKANFSAVKFLNFTQFSWSYFNSRCFFENALFRYVVFDNVIFSSDVTFRKTNFVCSIEGDVIKSFKFGCKGVLIDDNLDGKNNLIIFRHCRFINPRLVLFHNNNFKFTSFVGTDLSKIRFEYVIWDKIDGLFMDELLLRDPRTHFINDFWHKKFEFHLPKKTNEIITLYRSIREQLEVVGREYIEAGEFFIQEMDLKSFQIKKSLKSKKHKFSKKISLFFEYLVLKGYRITSKYGESIARVIFWILFTVPFFTLITAISISISSQLSIDQTIQLILTQFKHSFGLFFQVRDVSDETFFIDVLERVISIYLLGNLYIATRRNLERKTR